MKRLKTVRQMEMEKEFIKICLVSAVIFYLCLLTGHPESGLKIIGFIYLIKTLTKILWNFISARILLCYGEKRKVQRVRLYNTTQNSGHLHITYDGNQEMYSENYYWEQGVSQAELVVAVYKYYGRFFVSVMGKNEG